MPVGLMGFDQKIRHQYNIITSIVCAVKLFTFYTGDCYTDYATANLGAFTIVDILYNCKECLTIVRNVLQL